MTERRIPDVVGQARGGDDDPNGINWERFGKSLFLLQKLAHLVPEGTADAGHFEAMRESAPYIVALRKRVNLCLILEAPKR
jgi:hypothetical protein